MRRWIWTCVTLTAFGATIHYENLPKRIIQKRIAAVRVTNIDRQRTLSDLFVEAGCPADKLTEQAVKHSKVPNLICVMPGELNSAIVIGAHFDFVDAGSGVVDNWSGAALLPSLYQSLKSTPRRHRLVFIGFTDEEKGLVGSTFYLDHLSKEERSEIHAMVNMDSLGTSPTKLETDRGNKELENALALVSLNFKLPLAVVNVHAAGRSDSDSFQNRKIPAINIHSVTNQTFSILHSKRDQIEAIHRDEYYDSYRLIAAYLAYLDETLDPAAGP
jgi:Iap family predicted aminopeptidase